MPAENAAAALEVMSRFAVDPRWLLWLPPTMAPASTSTVDGYLEHPTEAFADYAAAGVDRVVCEEKHMGSRAVVVVCRDADRRQTVDGRLGAVYTRTGRPFFADRSGRRRCSTGSGRRSTAAGLCGRAGHRLAAARRRAAALVGQGRAG